jgi:hypothetical protein
MGGGREEGGQSHVCYRRKSGRGVDAKAQESLRTLRHFKP